MKNFFARRLPVYVATGIFLFVSHTPLIGQKYKKEKVAVQVVSLPLEPLAADVRTYSSTINPDNIDFRFIEKKPPLVYTVSGSKTNYSSPQKCEMEYMELRGYERVSENPDVQFVIDFRSVQIKNKQLLEQVGTFFENNQKVQRTHYAYEVTYTFGSRLRMLDKAGEALFEETYYEPETELKVLVGDPVNGIGHNAFTIPELDEMVQTKFVGEHQKSLTKSCLEKAEYKMKSTWGYPLFSYDLIIATDKSSKKLNYDDLNEALELTKQAFISINKLESMPIDQLHKDQEAVSAYNEQLLRAVAIWDKALEEANFEDKKARIHSKLAPMLYCNIAIAKIYMNDWEGASQAIEVAMKHEESMRMARYLNVHMVDRKLRYELHGIERGLAKG